MALTQPADITLVGGLLCFGLWKEVELSHKNRGLKYLLFICILSICRVQGDSSYKQFDLK